MQLLGDCKTQLASVWTVCLSEKVERKERERREGGERDQRCHSSATSQLVLTSCHLLSSLVTSCHILSHLVTSCPSEGFHFHLPAERQNIDIKELQVRERSPLSLVPDFSASRHLFFKLSSPLLQVEVFISIVQVKNRDRHWNGLPSENKINVAATSLPLVTTS